MNRTIVRLKVVSHKLTPAEITKRVGLQCDRSWRAGELRAKTTIKEADNGWIIDSGELEAASLETHVCQLLKRLLPHANRIKPLSDANTVEVSCVLYSDHIPALNFDPEVIRHIESLGASLDIDLYVR